LKDGKGTVSSESGAISNLPYSFSSRFEDGAGTNPEELLGAAHAGCFSMAFSGQLSGADFTPTRIATTATVTIEKDDAGFGITNVHLEVEASVPGIDEAKFQELAGNAKAGCPVSKLFNTEITMNAKLV
jgi:osmotically inducible protein OsmC